MSPVGIISATCFGVVGIIAIWMAVDWIMAPHIQLRVPSGVSWGAAFWNSTVWYDACGAPYAKAHGIGSIRLRPNGETDDRLYQTTWKHLSGPPVQFERAHPPTILSQSEPA